MLTRNLWTAHGLVNGSRGIVRAMGLSTAETAHQTVPSMKMVSFPAYTGPTHWRTESGSPLVPVTPMVTRWTGPGGQPCTRRQIPLRLAYAITVHKSQGMTLDRAILDLGESDQSRGLTFVAISRVRHLQDLAFRPGFDYHRLQAIAGKSTGTSHNGKMAEADAERRRKLGFASFRPRLGGIRNHSGQWIRLLTGDQTYR